MAIKKVGSVTGPKGAIPTSKGWVHPKTGELLKSQRITQEQLDEYNGVQVLIEPVIVKPEPAIEEYEDEVYAEDIEAEIQEEKPKPKKKAKKKSKKFSLFG
tara:strand:- start:31 stop:333 length:303 start_codon:yes stop_codon:yes gene_type:complete